MTNGSGKDGKEEGAGRSGTVAVTEGRVGKTTKTQPSAREARLAAALRANLIRRKEAGRAMKDEDPARTEEP